jgi:hypothetical protein
LGTLAGGRRGWCQEGKVVAASAKKDEEALGSGRKWKERIKPQTLERVAGGKLAPVTSSNTLKIKGL